MTDAFVPLLVAVPLLGAVLAVAAGLVSERGPPAITAAILVVRIYESYGTVNEDTLAEVRTDE